MGRRSIPYAKFANAIHSQKQQFGNAKGPSRPDPKIFRPGNLEQVVGWMTHWEIEPYWVKNHKTGKGGVMFRSIPRKGGGGLFHIKHDVDDIALYCIGLGLDSKDEEELHQTVASVQAMIRHDAGFDHAPFATKYRR
jgi:hypothetical protein